MRMFICTLSVHYKDTYTYIACIHTCICLCLYILLTDKFAHTAGAEHVGFGVGAAPGGKLAHLLQLRGGRRMFFVL